MSSPASSASRRSTRSRASAAGASAVPSSDLARPLPPSSSPAPALQQPRTPGGPGGPGGPGSVMISEIDLSSPLNYGTPSSALGTPRSLARGTPIRMRSDIQSERRLRQVSVATPQGGDGGSSVATPRQRTGVSSSDIVTPSRSTRSRGARGTPSSSQQAAMPPPAGSDVVDPSEASDSAPHLVIWGTDVSVKVCKAKFKNFINTFMADDEEEDEEDQAMDEGGEPLPTYRRRLEEIHTLGSPFLNISCGHIQKFDPELYRQLICYPQEVIPTLDMAVNELFFEKYPDMQLDHQIQVRPFNADRTRNMRALNPEDIDQLITITGMVIRTSPLIPEMCEALFKCSVCALTATVEVERGRIAEPTLCTNCNTNHSFTLVHNRSAFSDKQMVKLQESPEDMPAGQTPHTVVLYSHGDLVDRVQPGDRVAVTGVYRAVPMRVQAFTRNIRSVYKTHIDVVHFRKTDNKRLHDEHANAGESGAAPQVSFSEERAAMIEELSQKPDLYERLARAIAPSIYENDDIKKGILLQLFGGARKDFSQTGRGGNFRSEINILLCGDPGTSKSQLLQYVYNLVPRSQYTSGKGSSAVGLTAYVTKDPETRQLVLQTGALVLADNGICCIDEFDKMNDSTRSVLHEVMEQQTLSIAKAGIICQLNARTSILAAANPIGSQWNAKKTIIENIQLPHTLLSRFDLIFLMLDPQDELYDKRLSRHLVSLYYRTGDQQAEEALDMSILRDYIAFAKSRNATPKLTDEAKEQLIDSYVNMRRVGKGRGHITAYPRQLESLIRLCEAHAKMRLSDVVELTDVEEASRLHKEALKQSATDPITGLINASILTTGQSDADRKRREEVKKALRAVIEKKGAKTQTLNWSKTWTELKDASDIMITRNMFEDALKDLSDEEYITLMGRTTIRVLRR